jgi:hypothetical protein
VYATYGKISNMDIFCSSKFKNAHSKVLDFNVLHRHLLVLNKNNDN